jgi:hypothetical protein
MRWAGHVAGMRKRRAAYRVLVEKPVGMRSLENPNCKWQDNIQMYIQELGCGHGLD